MADAPRECHVISHTHWDREWYRPFHEFRTMLVRVVDEVLRLLEEDPDFRHFVLDGQAIVLRDYLEVRPEARDRIRRLVGAGRLAIGPFYVLPDEFLVSAEAHARNLLIGHRTCADLGGATRVGYLPDPFGHVAQLPQILRSAGIDSFVYTRGDGDEIDESGLEYRWRAPDGSEVLAVQQCGGYGIAGGLGRGEPGAVERVRAVFDRMSGRSNGDVRLLSNGDDHLPPEPAIGKILATLREAFPETGFRHSSYPDYLAAIRAGGFATTVREGELLGGKHHFILSGVWSARMPLKQRNDAAQHLLAHVVEPFFATRSFSAGFEYPAPEIDYAWRRLLENHPHDSICGCSVDQVHREMVPRFDAVVQTGETLLEEALEEICPAGPGPWLVLANTLPVARTEVVTRALVLPPDGPAPENLRLLGIGTEGAEEGFAWEPVPRFEPADDADARSDGCVTVRMLVTDFPALCHRGYCLEAAEVPPPLPPPGSSRAEADVVENGIVRVRLHPDGTFDLEDLRTGETYPGLHRLVDVEDVGDEYDWSPAARSETIAADGIEGEVRVVDPGTLAAAVEARLDWPLPARATEDRSGRSEERVVCPVRVRVTLTHGSPVVSVRTTFDNRVEDHRLGVEFPTPIATDRIHSDGHFLVNDRPVDRPKGEGWAQPPGDTVPQQEFSLVTDGERGLALLNRGLPEIAPIRGDAGTGMRLTLLRAVGRLSRDDLATRPAHAGPALPTPEAQCLGEHRFDYAVLPFAGDFLAADVPGESLRWRTPLVGRQGAYACAQGKAPLFTKTDPSVRVTAVKKHEDRWSLVVRLVNLAAGDVTERFAFGHPLHRAWRLNLLEERVAPLSLSEDGLSLAIPLHAHEIATVEIV